MGNEDEEWTQDVLKDLPSVSVPPALERRILADFDAQAARRRDGWLAGLRDAVWPGVPLWRPAGALAFALVVGVTVGTYLPLDDGVEQTASVALDAPPSFELGESS